MRGTTAAYSTSGIGPQPDTSRRPRRVHALAARTPSFSMAAAALALMATAWAMATPSASAYEQASRFTDGIDVGGGAGRHFTGSPADGYTCAVCHMGGPEPQAMLTGIPPTGYVPGTAYDLILTWPIDTFGSGAIEVVDTVGRSAGALALINPAALAPAELCTPVGGNPSQPGTTIVAPSPERQLVSLDACGASQLRVSWTAPPAETGTVRVHAVMVASDGSGDPTGDGVKTFRIASSLQGTVADGRAVDGSCAVIGAGLAQGRSGHAATASAAPSRGLCSPWWAAGVIGLAILRRRTTKMGRRAPGAQL